MEPEVDNFFKRQGRRGTNGIVVQVEGIPRKVSTISAPSLPAQSQKQYIEQQACSKKSTGNPMSVDFAYTKKTECKDFDDVISRVGSTGKYQKNLLYMAISPISAIQPILAFNAVFMLFTPDHWCAPPDGKIWDDPEEYRLVNIPLVNGTDGLWKYSSCTMYGPARQEVKCPFGWQYDRTDYKETMTSQHGWVCDNAKIPTYVLLSGTVGNAVGILTFGLLSDNWGRKPTLFLAIATNVVFRIVSLFVGSHWYLLCLAQFFVGSTTTALYVVPSLIAAELCDKNDRAEVYAISWTVCLLGIVLLPLISWICSDWFIIGLVTSGMGIGMLLYYPVVPESPRWLLQKGRVDEAAEILKNVQKFNNKCLRKLKEAKDSSDKTENIDERKRSSYSLRENSDNLKVLLKQVLERQHNAEEKVSISEGRGAQLEDRSKATKLFTKKNLAINTLLLTICWSMNTLIYTTMTYNSTHMSGSHFKNFFLLGIIEIPSGFFGGYLADTLGRRWTQSVSFGVCALTCFATAIMVHQRELEVLLATLSKLVATVSFLVVYCQATELFPTELRSTGSAIASTVGNFISICSPIISELSTYSAAYPWLAMAAFSIIGMVAASFLPETLNLQLPETIEEANNIGTKRKFWSFGAPKEKSQNISERKDSVKCHYDH